MKAFRNFKQDRCHHSVMKRLAFVSVSAFVGVSASVSALAAEGDRPTAAAAASFDAPKVASVVLPAQRHEAGLRRHTGIPSVAVSPANGRLWVTFYGGVTPGEDSNSYVPLMTSADGGTTWKTVCVAEPGPGRRIFDPELWVAPDGRLRWTFTSRVCRAVSVDNLKPYAGDEGEADVKTDRLLMAELDAGREPTDVPSLRPVADGVMMCKPTVLRDGTWMLPVAHWNAEPSACFFASTNGGRTFALRGGVSHFPAENRLYDEHTLVELRNGDLLTFIRAKAKPTVLESISKDGGRTWSVGKAARFAHTSSRHFLRRLKSGRLLLVKNGPIDADVGRERLMAYLSEDDGETWRGGLLLDGRADVSYPDGDESADGRLFVVHDHDRLNKQEVLLDVFTEQDVLAGRLVDARSRLGCVVTAIAPVGRRQRGQPEPVHKRVLGRIQGGSVPRRVPPPQIETHPVRPVMSPVHCQAWRIESAGRSRSIIVKSSVSAG